MNRIRVAALLVFQCLAILALHALGSSRGFGVRLRDLPSGTTRVDDALASGLRYVALAVSYWMLVSSLLYLAARAGEFAGACRAIGRVTLAPIKRTVDRALVVGVTMGTLLAPAQAMAQAPPPPVEQTYVPTPAGVGNPPGPLVVAEDETFIPPGVFIPPPTMNRAAPRSDPIQSLPTHLLFAQPEPDKYEVAPGDNLWSIALAHLTDGSEDPPSEGETAAYWIELIAANRATLSSGNPDLIYPGELLVMPPLVP